VTAANETPSAVLARLRSRDNVARLKSFARGFGKAKWLVRY